MGAGSVETVGERGRGVSAQHDIASAVEARGYFNGYTDKQLFARQVCKMLEEAAELAECVQLPGNVSAAAYIMGMEARRAFDDKGAWDYEPDIDAPRAMKEDADVTVTACCGGELLSRITGQPFDVVEAAVEKAVSDVKRGVRNGNSSSVASATGDVAETEG